MNTMEQTPIRVRDAITATHLVVALFAAFMTAAVMLLSLASWKGRVDTQLDYVRQQMDKMDVKLDRLNESVKERNK